MTPQLSRRDALRVTGGVAAAALAGCVGGFAGGESDDEPPENAGELGVPAETFTVKVTSRPFPEFKPQVVHVSPGTRVEWVVETGRHNVTGYHEDNHPPHRTTPQAAAWGSDLMTGPGSSYTHTFETEGVYDYVDTQQVCVSHEIAGNVGRVVVGWPEPADEPALAEPQPDLPSQVANALAQFNEQTRPVLEDGPE
ncbi:Plastocyanin [Halovenus aranensis]|uniref:Plastocyanin n=1 Tax=Halovenus aranensis TaxID=890420 RepID=A0A1G8VRH8_9EURY|nr:plastocyanin/azurin family copper-binding protein [Halovenus aranensis]SDJ68599.1 Plastocyanin [Halovenus aranensis]